MNTVNESEVNESSQKNIVQAVASPVPGMQNDLLASGSPVSHQRVTLRQMSESQLVGGFNPVAKIFVKFLSPIPRVSG